MPSRRAFLAATAFAAASAILPPRRGRAQPADPELAARALMAAYPADILDLDGGDLVFASGHRLALDDGMVKTFDQRLAAADPQDMFHDPYPWGGDPSPPARDFDPGRYRPDSLFRAIYGETREVVNARLVEISWLEDSAATPLRVHVKYGIAERLARISARLEALGADILPYLTAPGGTFNWRPIAGTARLSAHSFGIAIDINTGSADYWRWASEPGAYRNRIPKEIVAAFEAEDFIWGGRWFHYDTMHFEYRPELRQYDLLAGSD